jgi:hypothetical protein
MEELSSYNKNIDFYVVDIDESKALMEFFEIRTLPSCSVIKNGIIYKIISNLNEMEMGKMKEMIDYCYSV